MNRNRSVKTINWFYRRGVMNVTCPNCGGELVLGLVSGEDEIRCTQCKTKWNSENAPDNFSKNAYSWDVRIDVNSHASEELHPVDAAIITDWLMPDDEPMTWDERDGRYPHAVDADDLSGVQAQDMGIWFDEADGDGDGA